MSKILQFAVAIVAALWFTSDAFPHGNNHSSNLEEKDFYFVDKLSNESTQHGNPLKNETTKFNKTNENESIDKPHGKDAGDYISIGNSKTLISYYASLLLSNNKNVSRDAESLQDHKLEKEPSSRNTNLKTNRKSSTPTIYKISDTESISYIEFENSAEGNSEYYEEGNSSEYYEEGDSREYSYNEESGIKALKSNSKSKPDVQNHERISEGQQRSSDDNQKFTSEDFRFHRHKTNQSASRNGPVSGEFIDEYINPPTETVPVTNQPIFSNGRGNETTFTMPRDFNETNKLLPQNSDTVTESKTDTGEQNEQHFIKHPKLQEKGTREISSASEGLNMRTDSNTDEDSSESCDSDEDHRTQMQSDSPSYKTEKGSSQQPLNSTNSFTTSKEFNKTNRLLPRNNSTDTDSKTDADEPHEQHFVKHPKLEEKETREISSASEGLKMRTDSNTDEDSSDSDEDHRTQMQSESPHDESEKGSSQHPLNSTNSFTTPEEFNKTNRLLPRNNSTDTESKTNADEPHEQHFLKHPKLEEKETREISSASEGLKIRTDSNTDEDSSEFCDSDEDHRTQMRTDSNTDAYSSESWDSDEDHRTQMQSDSPSYKTEKGPSQKPPSSTKIVTIPGESKKTNRLQPLSSSIDTESKSDTDIPSEQHPELEEKENREFSSVSQESKLQTDSDADSDYSEYSDSEELYEYFEYDDEDEQLMSTDVNYFTGTLSNANTQSSENFTAPFKNSSMEIELPTSSRNDSKINTLHKTQGMYDSILQFLYEHSKNTWIKNLKLENRQI